MLWLRWFAVAAALTNIPYFLLQGTVLWPPVLWAAVFTGHQSVPDRTHLSGAPAGGAIEDEKKLYDLGFSSLRPREFLSLALVGEWRNAVAGEKILTEGEPISGLCIPIAGSTEVRKQGRNLGTFKPGHIIGTALALTGAPSAVEATFTEPARYMRWPLQSLRTFMDKRPDLRVALQGLVNRDLATKVEGMVSR